MAEVYFDDKYYGEVEDPKTFVSSVRDARRNSLLPEGLTVHYNDENNSVDINACRGRVIRPLIVVKDGKPLFTDDYAKKLKKGDFVWDDLVEKGIIEYLDAAEEEDALVAFREGDLTEDHTHLEIAPLVIFGLGASTVPFIERNQAARLLRSVKTIKQAVGLYASNYLVRMDMDTHLLHQPQIPVVKTITHSLAGLDDHPAGQNMVVAVMDYDGYNMADAIVMNRGSVQRGIQRSSYFRTFEAEEARYPGGFVDKIGPIEKDVQGYRSEHAYRYIEEDGVAYTGSKVEEGDVVIGRVSPPRFLNEENEYRLGESVWRESSVSLKHREEGVVDFVTITENDEGNNLVRVKIRGQKIPETGDKYTSWHGQKGIIGSLVREEDMPFSASGVVPDLLFSPHGIPSRMSISHLLESLGGKTGALSGRYIDGSPFKNEEEDKLERELLEAGFLPSGEETFYHGKTGRRFKAKIYTGIMYYMRLKHIVSNKIHARARGRVQLLTRQPTEGRAKEGGLKLGEMEKDTFVSHGASLLLKERFGSDKEQIPVCDNCGTFAVYDHFKNKHTCPVCGDDADVSTVEVAYAFKLFMDELTSLGIKPKMKLKMKYLE